MAVNREFYLNSLNGAITFFCIFGNTLTCFILSRKEFRAITLFRYYFIITILQTFCIFLMWLPFIQIFVKLFKTSVRFCKLFGFMIYFNNALISCIFTINSIDRFFGIKYPHDFSFRKNFKFQIIIIFISSLLLGIFHLPFYEYYEIESYGNESYCKTDSNPTVVLNLINLFCAAVIPFLLMIVFSCLTGHRLIKSKMKLNQDYKKDVRLFKIIVSMDSFFLLSTLPFSISVAIPNVESLYSLNSFFIYMFDFFYFLKFFHHSCSFMIHFLCNRKFRQYCLKYVKKEKKKDSKLIPLVRTIKRQQINKVE